jgi:hypothetical protein
VSILAAERDIRGLADVELAALYASADDAGCEAIVAELGRRDRLAAARRKREAARDEWQDGAYAQYLAAERETSGNLVNRRGVAAGVTDWSLWSGTEARARAYATEELRNFWDAHPRVTVTGYRQQASDGRRIQRDERDREAADAADLATNEGASMSVIGDVGRVAHAADRAARVAAARERVQARRAEISGAARGTVAVRERGVLAREPIDGAQLLADTRKFLRHYALWPSEAALTTATLWVAAAHARDGQGEPVWEYCAKLLFTASEYGAGKSWFAALTAALCPGGKVLLEPTKPSLIDEIADHKTVVVTEVDELLASPGRNRGIVAVLNACYEPGHYHTRKSGGKTQEIHLFGFGILDGVDSLLSGTRPDTRGLVSRCLVLRVVMAPDGYRRPRWDKTARALAARGRDRLGRWMAAEVACGIGDVVPELPEGLGTPRRCALWEPLFAVALRADKGERAGQDDPRGYWWTALADAALQLEAAGSVPDEDEADRELDDLMASWDEEG